MKLITLLSATAIVGSFAAIPSQAWAQATTSSSQAPDKAQACAAATTSSSVTCDDEVDSSAGKPKEQIARDQANAEPDTAIVVTGSRINRPTSASTSPLTSVTADDLLSGGEIAVGDALADLPQIRSTYSQANSTRFIGTSGLNFLDLRSLGIQRTLVLVNGQRHITASPGDYIVDVNTIPTDLIERVDVITGGDSAIYGSDAVAGVVNFVLKRNFDGLKMNAQAGVSTHGDRGSQFVSVVGGRNFADGRGNIAVAAEYAHIDPVYFKDRDFMTGAYSGRSQYNLTSETVSHITNVAEPAAGNGVVDNSFITGARNGSISDGGLITAVCTAAFATTVSRCRQSNTFSVTTAARGQRYVFNSAGQLVLSNPELDLRDVTNAGSTNTIGGLGSTLRNTGQLSPLQDRLSLNLLAHFDISDAFSPYVEAKYVKVHVNQEGQPSFFQGGALGTFRCNNGFLSASSLATLQSIGYCATPATSTFALSRFNVDFGGRAEIQNRETYRIVGGVRGRFNDDWKYELSVNYGDYKAHLRSLNNLVIADPTGSVYAKFVDAENAVLAPANFAGSNFALNSSGAKVICAINAATNVDSACVPINLFGYGNADPRALDYSQTTTRRRSSADEFVVNGFVGGDLSQLFELPGGPIAFVLGGEYRSENAYEAYDQLVQNGATFLNAIQPFVPPNFNVKEGFAELSIPLLKDMPFAQELTIDGAARISKYNTAAGTTHAYNVDLLYSPISALKFRATYARSVRVPTQGDLYSTPSQNFATLTDPCDVINVNNGTANRAANCASASAIANVPTGFQNLEARSATLSYLSGGNAKLTAETSDSYTVGVVIEPRNIIPGLSVTVDYYSINVNNLISTLGAQQILNLCFDGSTLNNQFCALINPRDADHTFNDTAVLLSSGVNFAREFTAGIDVDVAYNHTFGSGDKAGARFIGTWRSQFTSYTDPTNLNFANRLITEEGDPEFEFQERLTYKHGPFQLGYGLHYLGKQTINDTTFELLNTYQGRAPTNADAYDRKFIKERFYHDVRLDITINDRFSVYSGVSNIGDKLPPFGQLGNTADDSIYDNIGRYYFGGIKASF